MSFLNRTAHDGGRTQRFSKLRAVLGTFTAIVVALFVTAAGAGAGSKNEPTHGPAKFNSSFTHGNVAVEGGTVHYVKGGSGPALVLLHGWPQSWWEWHKVMPALAQGHTVIAFDLPGLGASSVPANGYDKATTARRLHEAAGKLGYPKVQILAHDVGSLVAYPWARDFPDDVSRIAVLDAPLSGFGLEEAYGISWHFRFNSAPAPIPEKIMDNDDVKHYLNYPFMLGAHHPEAIDKEVFYKAYAKPANRHAGYEYYRAFEADAADNRANAAAKRLQMPVMAVGGQFGFGPGVSASFRQVAADVREVLVPDSGHFIPEENPAFLADCAAKFFGGPVQNPAQLPPGCNA